MQKIKYKGEEDPINTFIVPFIRSDFIFDCVERIWEIHNPSEHRLILIDNTMMDETKSLSDNCHLYVRGYRNLGIYKSFNIGWMAATTKYVTFMGDDTMLLNKIWFDNIVGIIEQEELFGGCAVNIKNYKPDIKTGIMNDEEYHKYAKKMSGGQAAIFSALVLNREIHKRVGYFPEPTYPGIYHDGKILRMWEREKETPINRIPSSLVYHHVGGSQSTYSKGEGVNIEYGTPGKIIETKEISQYTNHEKMHL